MSWLESFQLKVGLVIGSGSSVLVRIGGEGIQQQDWDAQKVSLV